VTPPGLLGAALLFWGWQTGFLAVGVVMAVLVEARRLVRSRWDLSRADFNRVSDLSALARTSPSYFSSAFKRTFGASPHAYLMSRRISMAVEVMLGSDAPLSEIAMNCGFADQAHFSRQFRRTMGYTPSHWRRERAPRPFTR